MPPWRPETARGIPQAFQGCPLTRWAGEPMLQDAVSEGEREAFVPFVKRLALKRADGSL